MRDHLGHVVGITCRYPTGEKRIMKGHRAGLFMPCDLCDSSAPEEPLLITEGATDAVAASDLGFRAVGRHSCVHGATALARLVARLRPKLLVLVGDDDGPGRRGVEALASALLPYVLALKVIYPPKPQIDLRQWCATGATRGDMLNLISSAKPRRLRLEVRSR
jgi:hypothetical protein